MNYERLFSSRLPAPVEMPPGLAADTKYVFSITYADADVFPSEGLLEAMGEAMRQEGPGLVRYPPPQGHQGLRELIARLLKEKRGIETGAESIFLSGGAGGAIGVPIVERCILEGHR